VPPPTPPPKPDEELEQDRSASISQEPKRILADIKAAVCGFLGNIWMMLKRDLFPKIQMMLVALVAPELMLGFAVRQFFVACWFAKSKKYFFVAYYIGAQVT
jgi:ABC-type spermidine/putrescine transport system permease subunit II